MTTHDCEQSCMCTCVRLTTNGVTPIAFGCTEEDLRKKVFGLKLIGSPNEDAFNRLTGKGFVAACDGDYADAIAKRYKTHLLIVETTGAHNRALMELLRGLGAKAAEKGALDGTCYGEAHHSPRDFVTHQSHRCHLRRSATR